MQRFTQLYLDIDRTNRRNEKLDALTHYFQTAPAEDAIWAVYILSGRKIGRTVSSTQLRNWAAEITGYPHWLLRECYAVVGDLSETLSLLLRSEKSADSVPMLHEIIEDRLRPLGKLLPDEQKKIILQTWQQLDAPQRFVFHKLIHGDFRVGVSRQMLILALAKAAGVAPAVIAHRLSGQWLPTPEKMRHILHGPIEGESADEDLPYPFMLAHALTDAPSSLGNITDWQIEWKWDGIRAQLLHRSGRGAIWSRGDELISSAFPEILHAISSFPTGTVIDGEIVAWDEKLARPMPFATLQTRIHRKNVELSFWPDVPVNLIAFDLLEQGGTDLRDQPLAIRRAHLEKIIAALPPSPITLAEKLSIHSWDDLPARIAQSRTRGVEGVLLKQLDSPYLVGRPKGPWWKLKIDPYTVDAVLIAAQPGSGKRAGLLTDFTFGVWNESHTELVPVAKAYSGLTDAEIADMDKFIRRHTTERFGPVHRVEPLRVFELGFEAIQRSDRHKSGIALRFPRILRLRDDKPVAEAATLAELESLLRSIESKI